eukprot:CAMPEP_0114250262 /NCGR_PEP_ID=MMETSP0058-20121206/14601_1 /TAXON_ID=36894 /ORGANISM="Pyramimonas parkeae, CCMP726" /LENGTH=520 /DNA_ID=CAMNT_0001363901 /DNA_START=140 /DNA_END=1702 /DNA_ORIENTATION=-
MGCHVSKRLAERSHHSAPADASSSNHNRNQVQVLQRHEAGDAAGEERARGVATVEADAPSLPGAAAQPMRVQETASAHDVSCFDSPTSMSQEQYAATRREAATTTTTTSTSNLQQPSPWTSSDTFRVVCFSSRPYDMDSFEKAILRFEEQGNCDVAFEFDFKEARLDYQSVKLCDDAHAICVFVNDEVQQDVLSYLKEHTAVKLILLRCAGFNNVDVGVAADYGIKAARVPEYSPYAVAEHAVALLMTLNRKIHKAYSRVREGNLSLSGLTGFDMYGKTVGVIGTGKIGCCAINIFLGFGCKVIASSRSQSPELIAKGVTYVDLPTLFAQSHIISLHAPLVKSTLHTINDEAISQMRDGVVIINTSRGGLVDTKAAIRGLKSRKIGGLGLDVYEEEGGLFFVDHAGAVLSDDTFMQLVNYPNVILSGHQAFLTEEALGNIADTTLRNMKDFIVGAPLQNEVRVEPKQVDEISSMPKLAAARRATVIASSKARKTLQKSVMAVQAMNKMQLLKEANKMIGL